MQAEKEITKEAGFFTSGEAVVKCANCGEILSTELIPAKYPVSYLYIAIACVAVILAAIVVTALKAKGTKKITTETEKRDSDIDNSLSA